MNKKEMKTISSFGEIILRPNIKPLIICDIDDTIMFFEKDFDVFFNMIREDFPHEPIPWIQKEAIELHNMYKYINKPKHTDFDGFKQLVDNVNKLGGKIVFLTARHEKYTKDTKLDFEQIGLNYDDFKVYYTNNEMSKGDFIFDKIDLTPYENIIFIDDRDTSIYSVSNCMPYIDCYKFNVHKKLNKIE